MESVPEEAPAAASQHSAVPPQETPEDAAKRQVMYDLYTEPTNNALRAMAARLSDLRASALTAMRAVDTLVDTMTARQSARLQVENALRTGRPKPATAEFRADVLDRFVPRPVKAQPRLRADPQAVEQDKRPTKRARME